jgi:hypothetical protein
MAVFKVKDREFEILEARGRNGRKAVNWLITRIGSLGGGGAESSDITALFAVLDDEVFYEHHLAAFVGKEGAGFIDENATTGEMITGVLAVIEQVFQGFESPEVGAALKNLESTQEE